MNICMLCNSNAVEKMVGWGEYSIFKCNECNLIYTIPLPDEKRLFEFYQGFLYNKPDKSEVNKQVEYRKKELKRLFKLRSNINNKNFLDFGGGTGSAYKAACELKLKAYYHDLDEKSKLFVKEEYGLTDEFIIDNVVDTNIRFDYIFSDNVIEHIIDPVQYLNDLKRILKDDGQIVLKTPHSRNTESYFYPMITIKGYLLRALKYNSTSIALKSYFSRFWHCDPPRHLYSFSKQNLQLIALKAGFDESEVEVLYYNLPLFKYSLTELFFNFRKFHSIRTLILRVFLLPVIPLEVLSKILQKILLTLNIITPGGIILRCGKTASKI